MARKRKVGRPKGNKNKILTGLQQALEHARGNDIGSRVREIMKTADTTRLETAIVKFETAIDEAIAKLNRMV